MQPTLNTISNLPLSSSPPLLTLSTQTSINNENNKVLNNSNFEMTSMTLPPSPLSLQPQVPSSRLLIRNDTNSNYNNNNNKIIIK